MYESMEQEMKQLKKAILTGLAVVMIVGWICTMMSCNMIKGAGQDIGDAANYLIERTNHGWEVDE